MECSSWLRLPVILLCLVHKALITNPKQPATNRFALKAQGLGVAEGARTHKGAATHITLDINTAPYLRGSFPAGIMCSEAYNTINSSLQAKLLFLADMCKPHSSNQVTASVPIHHLPTVTRTKAPCARPKGAVCVQPSGQSKCPDTTSNLPVRSSI